MKTIIGDITYTPDTHEILAQPNFAPLDLLYSGRVARYGDYHAHASTGGTSDGHTTLAEWKAQMDALGIDFIGVMDHRQVRHMYLDDFDSSRFIYGTEPAIILTDSPRGAPHYLMLFGERDTLETKILNVFSEYEFTGGIEGNFKYAKVDRARFTEVINAVLDGGGAFVHAHPKQTIKDARDDEYLFVEGTALETIYSEGKNPPLCEATVENYKLWTGLLAEGHKVYNTATSDCHGAPKSDGISTVYTSEKSAAAYVERLRVGDLNAGCVGVKMCVCCRSGDEVTPVGGTAVYGDGLELLVRIDDLHPLRFDASESYRVDVISDVGLAYSAPLTPNFAVGLKVEKRRFYRVEVLRESDGSPMAIGNPIWLS